MTRPEASTSPQLALTVLLVVYTLNFVDRQIITILAEPIKLELGLSDTQLGFLTGTAFALFYSVLGLPIARLADRKNRVLIVTLALATWSLMTALSGLAATFLQLALARMGVAVGEAGGTPPSHSILSDFFPERSRATAMSVFSLGAPAGTFFGLLIGGYVAQGLRWRSALIMAGLTGFAIAIVVPLLLREPQRGAVEGKVRAESGRVTTLAAARIAVRNGVLANLFVAGAFGAFCTYVAHAWFPSFLIRTHSLSPGDVGAALALIAGLGGAIGALLGGMICDRLSKVTPKAPALVGAASGVIAFFAFVGALLASDLTTTLLCLSVLFPACYAPVGPLVSAVQTRSPIAARATMSGLLLLISNIVGLGMGPQIVGLLSDWFANPLGSDNLRYAMLCTAGAFPAAVYFYLRAARASVGS